MSIYSGLSANSDFQSPLVERIRPSRRWCELEKTKPLRALAGDVVQGLCLAAFIAAAWFVPQIIAAFN
jgi:hypothetical protein